MAQIGKLTTYTGSEFNKKYSDREFYKLTNSRENHNSFQYKTGLNIDILPIDWYHTCYPGGLYFCTKETIHRWVVFGRFKMTYWRKVTIPPDAIVCEEGDKFKSDKIILTDRKEIWTDSTLCEEITRLNPELLFFVDENAQTKLMCDTAFGVKKCCFPCINPIFQTYDMCTEAVNFDWKNLKYVDEKFMTEQLSLIAVGKNGLAIRYIKHCDQTEKICLIAIMKDHRLITYVRPDIRQSSSFAVVDRYMDLIDTICSDRLDYLNSVKLLDEKKFSLFENLDSEYLSSSDYE